MTISGYDSSSISTLFSSLNTSTSTGGTDLLGINYSDYATIRSGSYYRLMKSYYSLDKESTSESESSTSSTSSSTSKDSAKTLANIEEASESLSGTAKELYTRSDNKVFAKKSNGDYDTQGIYNKVSEFVEGYNSLLAKGAKSDATGIMNSLASMKYVTTSNESALSEIGISVDSKNGTLSLEKDAFFSSDMSKVKDLFHGTASYGYKVATQSSMVNSYAQAEAAKSNTYNSKGSYTFNYNSGSIFTDYF